MDARQRFLIDESQGWYARFRELADGNCLLPGEQTQLVALAAQRGSIAKWLLAVTDFRDEESRILRILGQLRAKEVSVCREIAANLKGRGVLEHPVIMQASIPFLETPFGTGGGLKAFVKYNNEKAEFFLQAASWSPELPRWQNALLDLAQKRMENAVHLKSNEQVELSELLDNELLLMQAEAAVFDRLASESGLGLM